MCTIIVRHRMDIRCTTVIAANRDEFYARKAEPPQLLSDNPRIVGGRDVEKGGTWFALTPDGRFFGVTNQRTWTDAEPAPKSRGFLALEVLAAATLSGMKDVLASVDARDFSSFNALFGDGREVCVVYGRREQRHVEILDLAGGVHVLCNDRLDSRAFPKAARTRQRVLTVPRRSWPRLREDFQAVLSDHDEPPLEQVPAPPENSRFGHEVLKKLQAMCIHTPIYGTVSSTVAAVNPGEVVQYAHAEGPPCKTPYTDCLHLVGR